MEEGKMGIAGKDDIRFLDPLEYKWNASRRW